MRDSFDRLYREGATHPKMLSIGLHCRIAGRFHIDLWLRTEYLRWDFLSFVSTITTVTEQQLEQVLALPQINATEYEHDIEHWFTASQLERMRARNPSWAALEAQLYADAGAPVTGQSISPLQQRIQDLVRQHIAPQRDIVELWRSGGVVAPTARARTAPDVTSPAGAARAQPERRPAYPTWKHVVPLPPAELLEQSGAPDIERFFVVGDAWAQMLTKFIASDARVLEIGCGCGRIARFLLNLPDIRYTGIDSVAAPVAWCAAHITPLSAGRFQFHHIAGVANGGHSDGRAAAAYRFPAADASVDLAVAASVGAQGRDRDMLRLLRDTSRVLAYGGHALLGVHSAPYAGHRAPDAVVHMAERCGLALRERIGAVCDEDVFVFEKAINWSPAP
jgi:SAM-dependent methyltransferase